MSHSSRGSRYVDSFSLTAEHPKSGAASCSSLPATGRTRFCEIAWKALTNDPWVLETVLGGLRIDFVLEPIQTGHLPPLRMADTQAKICEEEVKGLLEKGAIVRIGEKDGFISPFFAIPKKPTGYRPILNLKSLNEFVQYNHFKLENLENLR